MKGITTMTNLQTLFIVLGVIAAAAVVLAFALPFLKRRGVDMGRLIDQTKNALGTVDKTVGLLRPFLSEIKSVGIFDTILDAARVGVENAEQLYKTHKLTGDERKAAARQYILDTMKLTGIAITPEVMRIIDGAIEAEVFELGFAKTSDLLIPATTSEDAAPVEG